MMQTGSTSGDFLCVNIDTLERATWAESSFSWARLGLWWWKVKFCLLAVLVRCPSRPMMSSTSPEYPRGLGDAGQTDRLFFWPWR